jgi:RimJ/RimL family protein N-acetyltransferase
MITGDRIRLRAIERADLAQFVDWINDPEVRQGISAFLPLSMAREEHWFEEMLKRPIEEHPFALEIQQDKKWTLIGSCGIFDIDWISRRAEIGIMIGVKSQWNKGYGTETMRLILKHGFETLNLHRLFLRVFDTNPRAIRAYEKAGFVLEARLREAHFADGRYHDDLIMSVLRLEWEATQTKSAQSRSTP